jgi:hypothetical protein
MKRYLGIFLVLMVACGFSGCEELSKLVQPNEPPVIDRLFALRDRLYPGDTTTVKVEAHDPEGGSLSYKWRAEGGSFSSTTESHVVWTAPIAAKSYKITVTVRNDKGKETEDSILLTVQEFVGRPTVKIIQPADGAFIPGIGETTIEAVATPENVIEQVEFRVGTENPVFDNSQPYKIQWRVEGRSGPVTIIAKAYRTGAPSDPGVDSVRVNIEGVTRP